MSLQIMPLPRHLWRRLLALFIDLALASFSFALILLLIQPLFPGKIVFDTPIGIKYCTELEETPKLLNLAERLDPTLELQRTYTLCESSLFGQFAYKNLTVRVATHESGNTEFSRGLSTTVDDDLNEFVPFDFETIFVLALPFFFAFCSFLFGGTPGKSLLGLVLKPQKPTFNYYLCRELLRFAPFMIWGCLQLTFLLSLTFFSFQQLIDWLLDLTSNPIYWMAFAAVYFASLCYDLIPLIRWRGQMLYDRWSGFEGVSRA